MADDIEKAEEGLEKFFMGDADAEAVVGREHEIQDPAEVDSDDGLSVEESYSPSYPLFKSAANDKFYGKMYQHTKRKKFSSSDAIIPIDPSIRKDADHSSINQFQSIEDYGSVESFSPLDCTPIASCSPEAWNSEILLLSDCGGDQVMISSWVLNRMKSFKRTLGIACGEFDDKLMDLFKSIEERRRKQYGSGRKRQSGISKGARELKKLEWNMSYSKDSTGELHELDEARRRNTLSLSL